MYMFVFCLLQAGSPAETGEDANLPHDEASDEVTIVFSLGRIAQKVLIVKK